MVDDFDKFSITKSSSSKFSERLEKFFKDWSAFTIISLDPSDPDFYYSEYVIEWEDDPIGDQLGGYFIIDGNLIEN